MTARNPAPTMLTDYQTPALVWAVVAAVVLYFLTAWIMRSLAKARDTLSPEALNAALLPEKPREAAGCTIENCPNVGVELLPARVGFIWVCHHHAPAAIRWTGPAVYDQDLDPATDLATWDKEMDAS